MSTPARDGRESAEYDFHHVGTDFGHEIVDSVDGDVTLERALAAWKEEHRDEWHAEAEERYAGDGATKAEAKAYADAYVSKYFALVAEHARELAGKQRVGSLSGIARNCGPVCRTVVGVAVVAFLIRGARR